MKEIKLKILDADKPTELDYKGLIHSIISTPANPQAGLSLEDVRQGVRLLNTLEKSTEVLRLEDADYSYLTNKLKSFKFAQAHKNIVQFADDINNAKEVK